MLRYSQAALAPVRLGQTVLLFYTCSFFGNFASYPTGAESSWYGFSVDKKTPCMFGPLWNKSKIPPKVALAQVLLF
jgi:hypothetical protein